jgi:hypothetical protein
MSGDMAYLGPDLLTLYRVSVGTNRSLRDLHWLMYNSVQSLASCEGSKVGNPPVKGLPRRVNAAPPIFEYVPR